MIFFIVYTVSKSHQSIFTSMLCVDVIHISINTQHCERHTHTHIYTCVSHSQPLYLYNGHDIAEEHIFSVHSIFFRPVHTNHSIHTSIGPPKKKSIFVYVFFILEKIYNQRTHTLFWWKRIKRMHNSFNDCRRKKHTTKKK